MFTPSQDTRAGTWPASRWLTLFCLLSCAIIVVHGFHPFAEDGGLYAAGVEYTLDRSLFPHYTEFVTGHLRFGIFAPMVAAAVRTTHLPLVTVLLLVDWLTALASLFAARALLRRCTPDEPAQFAGVLALAAGWTLPVAGTSLYLMDPYVTARSISFPLSLFAIAYSLDAWSPEPPSKRFRHPAVLCTSSIASAALFHPLMAAYSLLFVLVVRATQSERRLRQWLLLTVCLLLTCLTAMLLSPAATAPERLAALSRYYWFLSQWHWFEWLGLGAPLAMLALIARLWRPARSTAALDTLILSTTVVSALCTVCACAFAHESSRAYTVARLQPLRIFVDVYAIMLLLLGAGITSACMRAAHQKHGFTRTSLRAFPPVAAIAMAAGLFVAARATYPRSPQVEWTYSSAAKRNEWVQAFLWARDNTPQDALFALDARYVNTDGEDAQTFRAFSLHSVLPDYSKDGGEASISTTLPPAWLAGANAQEDLSRQPDAVRDARLAPFGVTWMVLLASAPTNHACPYANGTVKVCRLPRQAR